MFKDLTKIQWKYLDENSAPRDLDIKYLPDEGVDIVIVRNDGNLFHGYFLMSSEYIFVSYENDEIFELSNIIAWKYTSKIGE